MVELAAAPVGVAQRALPERLVTERRVDARIHWRVAKYDVR